MKAPISYTAAFDDDDGDDDDDDDSSPVRRQPVDRPKPKMAKKHIISSEDDVDIDEPPADAERAQDLVQSVRTEDSESVWSPKPTKSSKKAKSSQRGHGSVQRSFQAITFAIFRPDALGIVSRVNLLINLG